MLLKLLTDFVLFPSQKLEERHAACIIRIASATTVTFEIMFQSFCEIHAAYKDRLQETMGTSRGKLS